MPEPLAPLVIVIHATLLVAVHEQLVPLVTDKALVLPVDETDTLVGVTEKVQLAACVNVTVCPATVIVPIRVTPRVLAPTV
jgi:hypothetical protein